MDILVKEGSLGSILLRSQIITEQELLSALEEQKASGVRIGEALIKLGIVTQEDIDWALSNQLNIPYVRLKKDNIGSEAVECVPGELARRYNLMPIFLSGNDLSIAMADPLNKEAIRELESTTGCMVTVSVGLIREIREMQELFYGAEMVPVSFGFSSIIFPPRIIDSINADLSGAKLLDYLLLSIVKNRLSSVSLQPLGDTILVVGRSARATKELGRIEPGHYPELLLHLRRLARINGSNDTSARGVLAFRLKGRTLHYQVCMLRGEGGDYVTIKLHLSSAFPGTIGEIGLGSEKEAAYRAMATLDKGLVLFSMRDADERCRLMDLYLDERETEGKTVLILGDNVGRGRKKFPRIPVSRNINELSAVIMATFDHDPDIIVIEDATDAYAFIASGKAAMHGKLVMAGVSFGDVPATFKNLIHYWQKNYFIPTFLKGVISLKGLLTLCPNCKERYTPSREETAALRIEMPIADCYRPKGCPVCDHTGYAGRKYLMGLIPFDSPMLEAFEKARDSAEIVKYLGGRGYRGIGEEALELLIAGDISPEEYAVSIIY
ncbi:pilus assembly protein PilB [Geotalea sp. SG265]|uniref:ATPase, T2SS/T4P/T4SS family n=1 Tax=Geotalea sp. SG265 TaxID=2922867 RepID=UPI001FAEFEDD|nr:pilus assembly protein PilB [Geotalea sp. SG265]